MRRAITKIPLNKLHKDCRNGCQKKNLQKDFNSVVSDTILAVSTGALILAFGSIVLRSPACFSGDSYAETINGPVKMSELRNGDLVLTCDGNYSPIVGFAHVDRDLVDDMLKITVASSDSLYITENHYIFIKRSDGEFLGGNVKDLVVTASEVKVGDRVCVYGYWTHVKSIDTVKVHGFYGPRTEHGTIVVNGFDCSSYAYGSSNEHIVGRSSFASEHKRLHRFYWLWRFIAYFTCRAGTLPCSTWKWNWFTILIWGVKRLPGFVSRWVLSVVF
jgi:hypothetical protein